MAKTTAAVIGTGGMARYHIGGMMARRDTTIAGFVEVSEAQREAVRKVYEEAGKPCPPFFETVRELSRGMPGIETAFIVTPHKFHYRNTCDCLDAGMDVLLEKPMVLNASEARRLIKRRDKTGRLIVVAFPGSLSPAVKKAKAMIAGGELGDVTCVSAYVHQLWFNGSNNTSWRFDPEISGGGFLFDTGSHMINTVVDLVQSDVERVSALLDYRGQRVEIAASVSGQFRNGVLFSLTAAGDSMQCVSQVAVFGNRGVLQTGIWGEFLRFKGKQDADFRDVPLRPGRGVWDQFLKVRAGKLENPCPPEIGLRFAKLMDLIHASSAEQRVVKG